MIFFKSLLIFFLLTVNQLVFAEDEIHTSCWMASRAPTELISFNNYRVWVYEEIIHFAVVVSTRNKSPMPLVYVGAKELTVEDDGWIDGFRDTWFEIVSGEIVGQYEVSVSTVKADPKMLLTYKKNGRVDGRQYYPVDKKNEHLCPLKPDYRVLREVKPSR